MANVAVSFDTLRFTKKLRQAGFTEAQAEDFAEVQKETLDEIVGAQLATKNGNYPGIQESAIQEPE